MFPPSLRQARLAGVECLLWAIEHRVELQELAVQCEDRDELEESLKRLHLFDDSQCNFVMSLSVSHMTRKHQANLKQERDQLRRELGLDEH